ncbi:MAG: hypothetical protein ACERJ2_18860 [Filomicrobium sp.]
MHELSFGTGALRGKQIINPSLNYIALRLRGVERTLAALLRSTQSFKFLGGDDIRITLCKVLATLQFISSLPNCTFGGYNIASSNIAFGMGQYQCGVDLSNSPFRRLCSRALAGCV